MIDFVPRAKLVESKSLKLYLNSFRNEAAFHEDCTVGIGKRLVKTAGAALAAHRRLLVSARRHADRRLLADRPAAEGPVVARHAASRPIAAGDNDQAAADPEAATQAAPGRASCAMPSATRHWSSASTPWASPPRASPWRPGTCGWSGWPPSSSRASRATWAGWRIATSSASTLQTLWPEARTVGVGRRSTTGPSTRSSRRAEQTANAAPSPFMPRAATITT